MDAPQRLQENSASKGSTAAREAAATASQDLEMTEDLDSFFQDAWFFIILPFFYTCGIKCLFFFYEGENGEGMMSIFWVGLKNLFQARKVLKLHNRDISMVKSFFLTQQGFVRPLCNIIIISASFSTWWNSRAASLRLRYVTRAFKVASWLCFLSLFSLWSGLRWLMHSLSAQCFGRDAVFGGDD